MGNNFTKRSLESCINVALNLICCHQFLQYLCALGNILEDEKKVVSWVGRRTRKPRTPCKPCTQDVARTARRGTGPALTLPRGVAHPGTSALQDAQVLKQVKHRSLSSPRPELSGAASRPPRPFRDLWREVTLQAGLSPRPARQALGSEPASSALPAATSRRAQAPVSPQMALSPRRGALLCPAGATVACATVRPWRSRGSREVHVGGRTPPSDQQTVNSGQPRVLPSEMSALLERPLHPPPSSRLQEETKSLAEGTSISPSENTPKSCGGPWRHTTISSRRNACGAPCPPGTEQPSTTEANPTSRTRSESHATYETTQPVRKPGRDSSYREIRPELHELSLKFYSN